MYTNINTSKDVMRERYIYGSELVGEYGFPMLPKVIGSPELIDDAVIFKDASKCKRPYKAICHFFTADEQFERMWSNPEAYIDTLQNFKYVCTPDFSNYAGMPLALRVYQTYRNRAIAWYMYQRGVKIIPTVQWGEPDSWKWCFDGLPKNSTLAVSTNGCHGKESEEQYRMGFHAMCERLDPWKIVCVGSPIEVEDSVPIVYFDGYSQQLSKRLKNERKRTDSQTTTVRS